MSVESQAERIENAATEFQRRFHISADEEHASSPSAPQQQVMVSPSLVRELVYMREGEITREKIK